MEKHMNEYKKEMKVTECDCGNKDLDQQRINAYPHEDGWEVKGLKGKQWLFIVCPECKYEWSLSKLGVAR